MRTQADREVDWSTGRELERKDAEIDRLRSVNADMLAALRGMLNHSCVADAAPEDKDPEDHDAERAARAAIAKATSLEPKGTET